MNLRSVETYFVYSWISLDPAVALGHKATTYTPETNNKWCPISLFALGRLKSIQVHLSHIQFTPRNGMKSEVIIFPTNDPDTVGKFV